MSMAALLGAVVGLVVVVVIVLIGYLARRFNVLDVDAEKVLNKVAFSIGLPALYFALVSQSSMEILLSTFFLAVVIASVICLIFVIVGLLLVKRRNPAEITLYSGLALFTNAGNMGIPVALALVNDATYLAPIILMQVLILSPVMVIILDFTTSKSPQSIRSWKTLAKPFINPIVISSGSALALNLLGVQLPQYLLSPIQAIGNASIPMLLIAFGMSIFGIRLFRETRRDFAPMVLIVGIKTVLLPVATYLVAAHAFSLSGVELLMITIAAALPSAASVYNFSTQYNTLVPVSREIVLITTVLSIPTILLVAALLG